MSATAPMSLALIPLEVLEHIAFFSATDGFLGPPSGVVPLLTLNRQIHSSLSIKSNPHLYARIFAAKFDVAPAIRRLGIENTSASALTEELQRRSILMKRMKQRLDSKQSSTMSRHEQEEQLNAILWSAYLMMLENDGKNERQLREYAQIDVWLKEFWFDSAGASCAMWSVRADEWPHNHERMSLAMWLFWLLLKPDDYMEDEVLFREATGILKLVALGAHQYPLCYPSWCDFIPTRRPKDPSVIRHYSSRINVVAPAPAAPAILAYLTLANKLPISWEAINYMKPLAPTVLSSIPYKSSVEWDGEWARTLSVGDMDIVMGNTLSGAFKPGSLEGVWEGLFTYTEFTAYAALLSGAPPATLQRSLVAQHRQTWKLREYHLISHSSPESDTDDDVPLYDSDPLTPGNPARGYIPNGTEVREGPHELEVLEPGKPKPIIYQSLKRTCSGTGCVKDVFVTGEGHSAWGQFNLIGRVRPSDGFISLSKEYVDNDRGKWLYRGYLVGNKNGNLSGRWRDTLTLPKVAGYEGCFVMSRRR